MQTRAGSIAESMCLAWQGPRFDPQHAHTKDVQTNKTKPSPSHALGKGLALCLHWPVVPGNWTHNLGLCKWDECGGEFCLTLAPVALIYHCHSLDT